MKKFKYIVLSVLSFVSLIYSCEEDYEVGDIIAPSNIEIQVEKVGADANNPNGDGSGTVNFTATANNATTFHFIIQNQKNDF